MTDDQIMWRLTFPDGFAIHRLYLTPDAHYSISKHEARIFTDEEKKDFSTEPFEEWEEVTS